MDYKKYIFTLWGMIIISTSLFGQQISMGISNGSVYYICEDSTLSSIGNNYSGQLGDGSSQSSRKFPVKVKGLQNITDVNGQGCIALKSDGTVWQWYKNNAYGLKKLPIEDVVDISCSYGSKQNNESKYFYVAVKADGTVWAWGDCDNSSDITWGYTDSIRQVPISNVKQVEAGNSTIVALCNDGTVWTWGNRYVNGNGVDLRGEYTYTPEKVRSLTNIIDIEAFTAVAYALKNDGTLWRWGYCGNATFTPEPMTIKNVKSINCESWFITAIDNYGKLNYLYHHGVPTNYCLPSWEYFDTEDNISDVEFAVESGYCGSSSRTFFAITKDGGLYRWGSNYVGQLGNFTTYDISEPELMPRPCLSVDCDTITEDEEMLVMDTLIVPGQTITVTSSEAEADLYWWYQDGTRIKNNNRRNYTFDFTTGTEIEVVLMDIYGCMRLERFKLNKLCNPSIDIAMDTVVRSGTSLILEAGIGTNYSWSPTQGLSCRGSYCQTTEVTIKESMTYTVSYYDEYYCEKTMEFMIRTPNCDTIIPYDDKIMMDTLITPGTSIELNASKADYYAWSPEKGLSCNDCKNPTANILEDTEYTVTLTDSCQCSWTERFLIRNDCNTYSLSHPTVLLDTVIGPDTELKLVAGEGFDYSWFPEDGLSCIDCQFPIAYINGDITYEVEYKDEYNCLAKEAFIFTLRDCDSTLGKNNILKLDTIIHYKSTLQLKAREGQYNYEWYPTDGLSCSDCPTTSLEINSSMEYSVRSLDKYSCELIERFRITKESNDIIIPNVITPNNDGINDYFEIIGLIPESILEIYNNRGVLVYKSEDYDGNWMGTDFNGNLLPKNNTYWYFLKTPDNKPKKGWVYIK